MIFNTKVILFDMDGVLANFITAFTTLGNKLFGTPIVDNQEHPSWDFRDSLTSEQQSEIWGVLRNTANWWASLSSLVSAEVFERIEDLTYWYEVYFVTHRMHDVYFPAGEQTIRWLHDYGILHPRVIVSPNKGEIAKAVGADYSIEDNWENACAIHWMVKRCKSFLIERRYNEEAREIIPPGIIRVKTVEEYLDYVEGYR